MKFTSLFTYMLLLQVLLLATPNDKDQLKLKITQDNNITYLKFMVNSPMIGEERYNNQKGLEQDFISDVSIIDTERDKKILDISTSSYFTHPMVKFKYIDIHRPKDIKLIITNNKGTQNHYNVIANKRKNQYLTPFKTIVSHSKIKKTDYRKQYSYVFKSRSINEAINTLYGTVKNPIENKIKLTLQEHNYCDELIPINISADVNLESLAIFNDKNRYPTIAVFSLDKTKMINLKFNTRMFKSCIDYSIVVVGKDSLGNFYKASEKARVACADACGGGG